MRIAQDMYILVFTLIGIVQSHLSFLLPNERVYYARYRTPQRIEDGRSMNATLLFYCGTSDEYMKLKVKYGADVLASPFVPFSFSMVNNRTVDLVSLTDDLKLKWKPFATRLNRGGLVVELDMEMGWDQK
ncbi:hypothetical protein FOL47_004672, partial [Perkinsus chesapeaki]